MSGFGKGFHHYEKTLLVFEKGDHEGLNTLPILGNRTA